MFKKPTRKQFIIRRIILSTIATVSVAIIVTVAVLFMLGYRLNSDNSLQQGALLQFDSFPNSADVEVDGVPVSGRTSTKQAVVAGTHAVTMKKAGYEDWSRSITVAPGTLTWLNYTRLVPTERKVEQVYTYEALSQMQFSPDLKWAIAHEAPASPEFDYIDLRSQDVKSTKLALPVSLYSESENPDIAHTFSVVRWNTPSRHVLIRHGFADKTEWLVVDTHDMNRSVNVTRLLSADFTDLQFAGTNGSSLYGLTTDGVIRKLDLGAGTMSRGFITHVTSFQMFSTNVLVYNGTHAEKTDTNVVGVYRDGDEASNVLREAPASEALRIATAQYYGNDYIAIAQNGKVSILKGAYPSTQARSATTSLAEYASFDAPGVVNKLSFSSSGEYVTAQTDAGFATYEIEYKRASTGVFASENGRKLSWLDAAHLWGDASGVLTMRDFDGTNEHALNPAAPGFDASLSQNGRYVYSVGQTDKGLSLQRLRMILE